MFSCFYLQMYVFRLPGILHWSFKNEVIQDEYSCCCCCCCFISFLTSSFYSRCYFILFFFTWIPCSSFNTLFNLEQLLFFLLFFFLPYFQCSKERNNIIDDHILWLANYLSSLITIFKEGLTPPFFSYPLFHLAGINSSPCSSHFALEQQLAF